MGNLPVISWPPWGVPSLKQVRMEPEMLVNELEHELKEVVTCCPKNPRNGRNNVCWWRDDFFGVKSRLVKMGLDGFGLDEWGESGI